MLRSIDIIDIITVIIQAHRFPFSKPHAIAKVATPKIIMNILTPISPIESVATSDWGEIVDSDNAPTTPINPLTIDTIPLMIIRIEIIVTPNGRLVCI
jgi:hypothetical protein